MRAEEREFADGVARPVDGALTGRRGWRAKTRDAPWSGMLGVVRQQSTDASRDQDEGVGARETWWPGWLAMKRAHSRKGTGT